VRKISILLLFPGALLAYQPGKFTPLDVYVVQGATAGPHRMTAKDSTGRVLEIAEFQYDAKGRLMRESYTDASGKQIGNTEYKRSNGRLTEEVRYKADGKILSRTVYGYEGEGLTSIAVYNEAGVVELRRKYNLTKGKVTGGEEIVDSTIDKFILKYKEDGSTDALVFVQSDGHPFGQILYRYDSKGRIQERERIQNEKRELCRYE